MVDFPPPSLRQIACEVATLLRERSESLSIAETAAGGLISAALLSTAGASKFYKGGLTLYTLESRVAFAGWTQETIQNYKGPTPEVVAGLAKHVRKTLGSTYTICESGTAGPTGGATKNRKPYVPLSVMITADGSRGYVALAVATEKVTHTREVETGLGEDREKNMMAFAIAALTFLKEIMA